MATQSQVNANRSNAKKSTGPRTETGRATTSRNHFQNGLYTQTDFVLPEEAETYREFCFNMDDACNSADDAIEECLAAEITSAAWRLFECGIDERVGIALGCDVAIDEANPLPRKGTSTLHQHLPPLSQPTPQNPKGPHED